MERGRQRCRKGDEGREGVRNGGWRTGRKGGREGANDGGR